MYSRFEKLRNEKKLTNADISRMTGISNATLSAWKLGQYVPKRNKLEAIAEILEVPTEYLIKGEMPNYYTGAPIERVINMIVDRPILQRLLFAAEKCDDEKIEVALSVLKIGSEKNDAESSAS